MKVHHVLQSKRGRVLRLTLGRQKRTVVENNYVSIQVFKKSKVECCKMLVLNQVSLLESLQM